MALAAGKLDITLEFAQNLKDRDWFGKQDPYCVVRCGQTTMRTKTHTDGGRNPVWNQTLSFNIINDNGVNIEIYDKDVMSRDDKIGMCTVDLSKVRHTYSDHQQVAIVCPKTHKQHGFISVSLRFYPNQQAAHHPAPGAYSAASPYPYPQPQYAPPPAAYAYPQQPAYQYPPQPAHAYPPPQPAYQQQPPPAYQPPYGQQQAPAPYQQQASYYQPPAAPPAPSAPSGYYPSMPTQQQFYPGMQVNQGGPPPPINFAG